jgi:hypothetical protein
VLVLVAGCSGDGDEAVRTDDSRDAGDVDLRTDASTTTSPSAPPATAGEGPPDADDDGATGPPRPQTVLVAPVEPAPAGATLGEALLVAGPVGWVAAPETEPDLGPLSPAEAAAAVGDPDAELALLTTRRLRLAYARRWTATDGATATVVAYAFADAEGALAYEVDSYLAILGGGAVEEPRRDGARGFTAEAGDEVIHGRSLRVGGRLFVVLVRGEGDDARYADALLAAQRVRLGIR